MTSDYYAPKRYVSLENHKGPIPLNRSHRGSSGCGFLRCCCCCFRCCRCCICSFLFIIFIFVAIVIALYYFLEPNMPTYNVENLDVNDFNLQNDKLHTDIAVVVKAENPNENIGLEYLENEVSIMYSGSQLCAGQFRPFLQPRKNTTNVNVTLKGDSDFGPEMQNNLLQDQKLGHIPLLIVVKVPIRLVIDDFIPFGKFVVDVNCSIVIDQLQPNKRPKILKKECYSLELKEMLHHLKEEQDED